MTRHKQEGAARTHIRVSAEIKQAIQELKQKHGFTTTDQVLRYYLISDVAGGSNRPIFHTAKEIYDLTKHNPDIDRMIKDASNQIMQRINKSEPRGVKDRPTSHKPSWQRKNRRF